MLNPQQQQGDLLLHGPPPVFGKPWFWQRSSSTMESTRSLAQVIMEMRDEIKKLEAENRELRRDSAQDPSGDMSGEGSSEGTEQEGVMENPYGNLRRNAYAPILEGQLKENSVMTVRRYSTSSNSSGTTVRDGKVDKARQRNSAWGRLQEELRSGSDMFDISDKREVEEVTNRHSLQEYVQKNRAKVKSVSFLLPVDDIYTNRPVLTKHLEEEPKITGLASISETDS